jgi:hypothetical protein
VIDRLFASESSISKSHFRPSGIQAPRRKLQPDPLSFPSFESLLTAALVTCAKDYFSVEFFIFVVTLKYAAFDWVSVTVQTCTMRGVLRTGGVI